MRRKRTPASVPKRSDLEEALAALDAAQLREVVGDLLLELDERTHARVVTSLIERAARAESGWVPAALDDGEVGEAVAFAEAAARIGYADPADVDERLRRGSAAFLGKDYAAARRIFGALLRPIGEADVDLGQHEMLEDVLGVDPASCAAQYAVCAYMLAEPAQRARAMRAAIDEVSSVGCFLAPIQELERTAVEPLPGLDAFLPRWRALLAEEAAGQRRGDWESALDGWLREVVRRMEGAGGLAKIARSTRRYGDLRAWCESLVEARAWKAALAAYEEAAELVARDAYARGELLDGAALAAQELGGKDLSRRLERAWRAAPSLVRLRRWLGVASGKAAIRKRAGEALGACPKRAHRQRALLHVLQGEFEPAAKLLAAAPGLGWSSAEHPGHLIFPLFQALVGDGAGLSRIRAAALPGRGMDVDELELLTRDPDEPRLRTPGLDELLQLAGIDGIPDRRARAAVLRAMRKAAERRVAGVTGEKRRRYYGHAAELVAACLACDRSRETLGWLSSLRAAYRRFPALRAELDRHLGAS